MNKNTTLAATLACGFSLTLGACSFSSDTKKADSSPSTTASASTTQTPSSSASSATPSSASTSSSPSMSSTSASSSSTSSAPPLAGGMPTVLKDGDMFMKGEVSDKTRAVEQQKCGPETQWYVKDHYLYSCDEMPDHTNHFHLVRPCGDLKALDKKAVGAGAKQQTWKASGKVSELFKELPDTRLRYLVTLVQKTNDGKTVAQGSAEMPYTHKDGENVTLSVPMWVTDRANQFGPKQSPMTVCFTS